MHDVPRTMTINLLPISASSTLMTPLHKFIIGISPQCLVMPPESDMTRTLTNHESTVDRGHDCRTRGIDHVGPECVVQRLPHVR